MYRDYMVRFWKRVLTLGKTIEDVKSLKDVDMISEEEYNAITYEEVSTVS